LKKERRRRVRTRPGSRGCEPNCGRSTTATCGRERTSRTTGAGSSAIATWPPGRPSELLLALVDLADGFDRALVHIDESPDSVAAGLHGMRRRLSSLLEAEGVKSFESVGQLFDPRRHEAMATVRDSEGEPGTVVDEAGRGYLWKDELLRPARVRVAE
jgi:hypothetical protein